MDLFKDLQYERPDLKQLKKQVNRCLARFKAAGSFAEADEAFLEMQRLLEKENVK